MSKWIKKCETHTHGGMLLGHKKKDTGEAMVRQGAAQLGLLCPLGGTSLGRPPPPPPPPGGGL